MARGRSRGRNGRLGAGGLRILDTDLAANLGMAAPRNIRSKLIEPHREELEGFGALRTQRVQTGGRPGTAFHLNEE